MCVWGLEGGKVRGKDSQARLKDRASSGGDNMWVAEMLTLKCLKGLP